MGILIVITIILIIQYRFNPKFRTTITKIVDTLGGVNTDITGSKVIDGDLAGKTDFEKTVLSYARIITWSIVVFFILMLASYFGRFRVILAAIIIWRNDVLKRKILYFINQTLVLNIAEYIEILFKKAPETHTEKPRV